MTDLDAKIVFNRNELDTNRPTASSWVEACSRLEPPSNPDHHDKLGDPIAAIDF